MAPDGTMTIILIGLETIALLLDDVMFFPHLRGRQRFLKLFEGLLETSPYCSHAPGSTQFHSNCSRTGVFTTFFLNIFIPALRQLPKPPFAEVTRSIQH